MVVVVVVAAAAPVVAADGSGMVGKTDTSRIRYSTPG